jgi:hypothetical protein
MLKYNISYTYKKSRVFPAGIFRKIINARQKHHMEFLHTEFHPKRTIYVKKYGYKFIYAPT